MASPDNNRGALDGLRSTWSIIWHEQVWTIDGLTWLGVAVGVYIRLTEYFLRLAPYIDEVMLMENLVGRPVFDLWTTLTQYQLVPPIFLIVERLMVRLPFDTIMMARLIPLLSGIASIFLFRRLAQIYLGGLSVPIAVWLFAMCDYLLDYSAEVKPYSTDVLMALLVLLVAAPVCSGALTRKRAMALAGVGTAAIWCSFPVVFVLAGIGTLLVAQAATRRSREDLSATMWIGSVWLVNFGICQLISSRLLEKGQFIWTWWDFAFIPFPPRSGRDVTRIFLHIINIFISPTGLVTPFGMTVSALLCLALAILGGVCIARRSSASLWVIVSPVLFALAASAMRKYPFHARLILFLIPSIDMIVARGIAAVGVRAGRWLAVVLTVLLISQSARIALRHQVIRGTERPYDAHGDLRYDLLDDYGLKAKRN